MFDISIKENKERKQSVRGTYYTDGTDDYSSRRVELIPANYPVEKFRDSVVQEFVYDDAAFWEM